MKTAVFFVGELHDNGFNASALAGAQRASASTQANISIVSGVPYDDDLILDLLRQIVSKHHHTVFIGGQGNKTMPTVANENPNKLFTIIQGDHVSSNLCSYEVRQEDSAFLAGYLAARLTGSGIVSHLSGHRVRPGLKGRAAYVAGAALAEPQVEVLTSFCGTQDDNATTYRWAKAQFEAGADILFTMLNGARQGAIDACLKTSKKQIGNALDWCRINPEVFLASALAGIDLGVERAITDALDGLRPSEPVSLGLAQGDYASLSLGDSISADMEAELDSLTQRIALGEISVPTTYSGDEFVLPEDLNCHAS